MKKFNKQLVERAVKDLLIGIGEDTKREGLLDTPKRVAKSWQEITSGYRQTEAKILKRRFAVGKYDEMVMCRGIEFYSMCEHHLLPFSGQCHVAYIPSDKVIGLSKMARLVEMFCKRLQIQELLTKQIAEAMQQQLNPLGVAVMIEAGHLCMKCRGVKKTNSDMVTSMMLGVFKKNPQTRHEFLTLVKGR